MMMIPAYFFKARAWKALKGNWQTALLVSFFATIFTTALQLLSNLLVDKYLPAYTTMAQLQAALLAFPVDKLLWLDGAALLALIFTPVLSLGCCAYFLERLRGREPGFKGLFSRMGSFGKALWLYVCMGVRVLLWSLLLVVPGVIAAFRYALAPYYLSEDPTLTASECIEKSKATMQGAKMSLFALLISFVGWQLLGTVAQLYLMEINNVASIVVGLCISLFVATYTNAAVSAFYLALSDARLKDRQSMTPEQISRVLASLGGVRVPTYGAENPFGSASDADEDVSADDDELPDDDATDGDGSGKPQSPDGDDSSDDKQ